MPSKEDLQRENERLQVKNESWELRDDTKRRELSKALGSYINEKDYYTHQQERKLIELSWEQIFVEVGRLIAQKKALQYVEDVEGMKREISSLRYDFDLVKDTLNNQ